MKGQKDIVKEGISPIVLDILDRGLVFLFAINPSYAYRWAINNNAFVLSAMLKKFEEAVRSERDREFIDWLKIGVFIMMVLVGLGILVYLLILASKGQVAVPNILPTGGGGYRI